jgi:hypothetical protein
MSNLFLLVGVFGVMFFLPVQLSRAWHYRVYCQPLFGDRKSSIIDICFAISVCEIVMRFAL